MTVPLGAVMNYDHRMKKFAISFADDQADAIEEIRRRERIPRSRVFQRAVALYLAERSHYHAVRAYEEGYRRKPEGKEVEGFARATAEVLDREDWDRARSSSHST
jgi:hypothetical protein